MGIEIKCDGEHSRTLQEYIGTDDKVFCERCYTNLEERIKELEEKLSEKQERNEKLEQDIADLQKEG